MPPVLAGDRHRRLLSPISRSFPRAAGWLAARWTAPRTWHARAGGRRGVDALRVGCGARLLSGFGWLSLGYSQLPAKPACSATRRSAACSRLRLPSRLLPRRCSRSRSTPSRPRDVHAASRSLAAIARARRSAAQRSARIEWTAPVGRAGRGVARPGQRRAGPQVRSRVPERGRSISTRGSSAQARGRLDRAAGERVPGVRGRGAGGGAALDFCAPPPNATATCSSDCSRWNRRCPAATSRAITTASSRLATARPQLYRKRHLVPFGETIPLEPVRGLVHPLDPLDPASRARRRATPTRRRSRSPAQSVAVDICYEDAFGADIRPQAERGDAPRQRHQRRVVRPLARRRAARPDRRDARARDGPAAAPRDQYRHHVGDRHDGREIARLPWFTRGILEVEVTGRQGITPYVRFGDVPRP